VNGRRLTAGLAGLALLIGLAIAPPVQQTEAYFTDSEYATATFTGITLATPVITSCTVTSFLGTFTGVTIVWTSPNDKIFQRLMIKTVVVDQANITQSGTGPYTYTSVISSGLLNTLLGSLLGATNPVKVDTFAGTQWVSPGAATRTLSVGGLLGLGGNNTCT
jgi:hypothetical protein